MNKKIKNKILSALFIASLSASLFTGMAGKNVLTVQAATIYDGVYSELTVNPKTLNGTVKDINFVNYNDNSQFPQSYTFSDENYFGVLPFQSANWTPTATGTIASKNYETIVTKTIPGKKSILPNGNFKVRQDGSADSTTVPAQWTLSGVGGVWRNASTYTPTNIAITAGAGTAVHLDSDFIPITERVNYTIGFHWAQESNVASSYVQYMFYNSSGALIGGVNTLTSTAQSGVGLSGTTRTVAGVVTSPTGATSMVIRLGNGGRRVTTNTGGTGAWFQSVYVVSGNLYSEYGAEHPATIDAVDGDYKGTIAKKPNTTSFNINHGESNRYSPVITTTRTITTANLFNSAAGHAANVNVTFADPSTGTNKTGSIPRSSSQFIGDRLYSQVNGPDGKGGYATVGYIAEPIATQIKTLTQAQWFNGGYWPYKGYDVRGYEDDFDEQNVVNLYGTTGKTAYGGRSSIPQLGWYGQSLTYYKTAATAWNTYNYNDAPRINNDTGYAAYIATFEGMRTAVMNKDTGVRYKMLNLDPFLNDTFAKLKDSAGNITSNTDAKKIVYPFFPANINTGDVSRTDSDIQNLLNYKETSGSIFDYGFVLVYNGWWGEAHTDSSHTQFAWAAASGFNSPTGGDYRRFVNLTYAKTESKTSQATYSGRIKLDDIAPGNIQVRQTYEGTLNLAGTTQYDATPTYSGQIHQRLKANIDKAASPGVYKKYDNIYVHDIQTYDENVTSVRVQLVNYAGNIINSINSSAGHRSTSGTYHKFWNVVTIPITENIPDSPVGRDYKVRVISYNGSTELKRIEIPVRVRSTYFIDQPTISSQYLYVGEEYTINLSGSRLTDKMEILFPFAIIAPNGTEITPNTWVTIPRSDLPHNTVTDKRTGQYTFRISENQSGVNEIHDIQVRGTSITDEYMDAKIIQDVYLRVVRIIDLEMKTKRWSPTEVINVNQKGPVATPIQIKSGYKNSIQIEHRRAARVELEFFVGNTPVNDIQFFTSSGDMVRYSGVMLNSNTPVLIGDRTTDHKVTVQVSNPHFNFVDVEFIIPQVFRDTNIGNVLSIKIKAYDEYGYIINNTKGDRFLIIAGSEKRDREDPNNIR